MVLTSFASMRDVCSEFHQNRTRSNFIIIGAGRHENKFGLGYKGTTCSDQLYNVSVVCCEAGDNRIRWVQVCFVDDERGRWNTHSAADSTPYHLISQRPAELFNASLSGLALSIDRSAEHSKASPNNHKAALL